MLNPLRGRKTNLCTCDYLPEDNEVWTHAKEWLETHATADEDVVVLLGAWTHKHFPAQCLRDRRVRILKVRHPASLFGAKGKAEAYQAEVMQKILQKLI